ncbi:MAG: hypothetical protein MZW92_50325, partial [Comamonadaceae bacterium]|nr:hypothetical protein [Comamonadaceae bacterium]
MKSRVDGFFERFGLRGVTDRVVQAHDRPAAEPPAGSGCAEWRDLYEHHLLIRVSDDQADATREYLRAPVRRPAPPAAASSATPRRGARPSCTASRSPARRSATARCTAASAGEIVALDVALRRNDREWVEQLPGRRRARRRPQALLRPLLLPRVPPGLHRQGRRRSAGDGAPDVGAARRAPRRVPGRAQRRPPVRRQAGAGRALPAAGPDQHLQPRHRP